MGPYTLSWIAPPLCIGEPTSDFPISRDNAMEHLCKQYLKRSPDNDVLGSVEEPVAWGTLGPGQKVSSARMPFCYNITTYSHPFTGADTVGAMRVANDRPSSVSGSVEE